MSEDQGSGAPQAPAVETPAVNIPEQSASPENVGEVAAAKPVEKEIPESLKQRIGQLSRLESKWRREASEAKARADYLEKQYVQPQQNQPVQQPNARESQVDQEQMMAQATEIAEFNLKCDQVADAGKKLPGFEKSLANLGMIGMSTEALGVIIDSDDAPKILAHLGNHLDEAAAILAKSPTKMARAIAKLEHTLNQPPAISEAPNPLTPVRTKSSSGEPLPSDPEWSAWRNKTRFEKFGRT